MRQNMNWTPDEKFQTFLSYVDLHDIHLRHENFQFLKKIYSQISRENRELLIQKILKFRWKDTTDPLSETHEAYIKMDWLNWLSESDSSCLLVSDALRVLKEKHPEWSPSDHPDFLSWHSGVQKVSSRSPWSPEILLGRSPEGWMEEFRDHQETSEKHMWGPSWEGLLQAVFEAAKQNFEWGVALAQVLLSRRDWSSELWDSLINSWSIWPEEKEKAFVILGLLSKSDLYPTHVVSISNTLYAFVRNGGKSYSPELINDANEIVHALWPLINEVEVSKTDLLLDRALNNPAGIIALFWLKSLSVRKQNQSDSEINIFSENYKGEFERLWNTPGSQGVFARTIISSQLAFLFYVDEEWTKGMILPLFMNEDPFHFLQAWEGFLTWGNLNPQTVSLLKPAFLFALSRLEMREKHRQRFIEYYADSLAFYVENPLEEWIPKFFEYASSLDRVIFASHLGFIMRNLDEDRQITWWKNWLSKYWKDRNQGLYSRIDKEEMDRMLEWVPRLSAVFPEVVDGIIKAKVNFSKDKSLYPIFVELKKNKILLKYPEQSINLIIYLLENSTKNARFGLKELLEDAKSANLSASLKLTLDEKLVLYEL